MYYKETSNTFSVHMWDPLVIIIYDEFSFENYDLSMCENPALRTQNYTFHAQHRPLQFKKVYYWAIDRNKEYIFMSPTNMEIKKQATMLCSHDKPLQK